MRLEITASNAIVRTVLLTDPAVFPMIPRLLSEGTSSLARHRYAQLFLEVWPIVSQDRGRDGIGGGVTTPMPIPGDAVAN